MTEDKVLAMVLDLLAADSTISAIVTGADGIRFARETTPTEVPCIYVGNPEGESDEAWSDTITLQLEVFQSTRQGAWTLAGAVDGVLNVRADTYSLDSSIRANYPTVKLNSIIKSNALGQEYPDKNGNTVYSVLMKYEVRGKAT